MFVLVVGGGKVGYYLAKELIDGGHETGRLQLGRRAAVRCCAWLAPEQAGGALTAGE